MSGEREKEEILVKKNVIFTAFDASLTMYQNGHIPVKTIEMNEVFECRKVIAFASTKLHGWLKTLLPLFHPDS